MKITRAMSMTMGCLVGILAVNLLAAESSITDVTVRQRWPWSRLVDVNYVLDCDPTQRVHVTVQAYNGSEKLALPSDALSGDRRYFCQCGAESAGGWKNVCYDPVESLRRLVG